MLKHAHFAELFHITLPLKNITWTFRSKDCLKRQLTSKHGNGRVMGAYFISKVFILLVAIQIKAFTNYIYNERHGQQCWSVIATFFTGCIGKQCRKRGHNHLRLTSRLILSTCKNLIETAQENP
ncbi:unnamed protein product [Sphagnum balticum]